VVFEKGTMQDLCTAQAELASSGKGGVTICRSRSTRNIAWLTLLTLQRQTDAATGMCRWSDHR
jgi:hypothetical protein